jgi:cupin superfamily acireductone dioxygenase involved in methionine salvage
MTETKLVTDKKLNVDFKKIADETLASKTRKYSYDRLELAATFSRLAREAGFTFTEVIGINDIAWEVGDRSTDAMLEYYLTYCG